MFPLLSKGGINLLRESEASAFSTASEKQRATAFDNQRNQD
jgi:hypothetical protein